MTGEIRGSFDSFVIVDYMYRIVSTPDDINQLESIDFDIFPIGAYSIYYIRYGSGLQGLTLGASLDNLTGLYDLSNSASLDVN